MKKVLHVYHPTDILYYRVLNTPQLTFAGHSELLFVVLSCNMQVSVLTSFMYIVCVYVQCMYLFLCWRHQQEKLEEDYLVSLCDIHY